MTYKVEVVCGDELEEWQLEEMPSNGPGDKEFANYLKIIHNGEVIDIHHCNVEPEDVSFNRDFKWVKQALEKAYNFGKNDQ